jgi:hypothetical protein
MVKTNREQREALFKVFQRDFPSWVSPGKRRAQLGEVVSVPTIQYRRFRNRVSPGPGCIMVPCAGIWLGIETDGYTHS